MADGIHDYTKSQKLRISILLKFISIWKVTYSSNSGTSIRPEDLTRNIAQDIIEQFPMVLFRTKSGKAGRKCSNILKKARQEVI